jgi:hypothetical protein
MITVRLREAGIDGNLFAPTVQGYAIQVGYV